MFTLSTLPKTVHKHSRRIGRGIGSGKGKNAGHGHKGQIKRNGGTNARVGFEGGHRSLIMRMPKLRGYNNKGKNNWDLYTTTISALDRYFDDGATVNLISLMEKGMVNNKIKRVRVIATGTTTKKFTFGEECYLTAGAKTALVAA